MPDNPINHAWRSQKWCLTIVRHHFWDCQAWFMGSSGMIYGIVRHSFWDLTLIFLEFKKHFTRKKSNFWPKRIASLFFTHKNTAFRRNLSIRCTIPLKHKRDKSVAAPPCCPDCLPWLSCPSCHRAKRWEACLTWGHTGHCALSQGPVHKWCHPILETSVRFLVHPPWDSEMAEKCWILLEMAWNGWKRLEMAGNGCKCLEMVENGWNWVQMTGSGWKLAIGNSLKLLELNGKCLKWLEIVENDPPWLADYLTDPVWRFRRGCSTNTFVINCRSPDFKSPTGPTKNLERHYNRVVVCLVGRSVGWLQRWL